MIESTFYLSETLNIEKALALTGLDFDELEAIVGRFANHSHRAGLLRGEVVIMDDGSCFIRHHFSKKILWNQ